jgi:phosphoglycolate phosphatase
MKLFLDLDGTIIDVSERYYRVYAKALGSEAPALTQQQYWELKRRRIPEDHIIAEHHPAAVLDEYTRRRQLLIEDPQYLHFDALFPETLPALTALSKRNQLYLVTLRRSAENLQKEIDSLGIRHLFTAVLTTPSGNAPSEDKERLIRPFSGTANWIVGDTEADILAGQKLHMTTCAVLSGIRSRATLKTTHPDHLIDTIGGLPPLIR